MRAKTRILMVAIVALWIGWRDQPMAAVGSESSHVCDDVCSGGAACDAECWLTQFDYDQDYPSTSCGNEGYTCCGDGWCEPASEGCGACSDDCGDVSCESGGGGGSCYFNFQCPNGSVCSPSHVCTNWVSIGPGPHSSACGGSCTNNSQCCGTDVCIGDPGQKYCGTQSQEVCPDSPACDDPAWFGCDFSAFCGSLDMGAYDAYCDPNTFRCAYKEWGYGCLDGNVCHF